MKYNFFNFIKTIFLTISGVFFGHMIILKLLKLPLFDNQIILAYLINVFLAILIYLLFYKLKERLKNQLGFVFIFGSFLKFILFFVFFYASYRADENISILEFSSFFTPYSSSLIIEVFYMSQLLNKME